jgi:hypothetical protein
MTSTLLNLHSHENSQTDETVLDAVELIETFAALGGKIPAPKGTIVWVANIPASIGDKISYVKGIYQTREEAISAVACQAMRVWDYDDQHSRHRTTPWMTNELFFATKTREEAETSTRTLRILRDEWLKGKPDSDIAFEYCAIYHTGSVPLRPGDFSLYITEERMQ